MSHGEPIALEREKRGAEKPSHDEHQHSGAPARSPWRRSEQCGLTQAQFTTGEDEEIEELKVELLTRWSREQCGRELARARRSSQR
jgi:hypothetical protein